MPSQVLQQDLPLDLRRYLGRHLVEDILVRGAKREGDGNFDDSDLIKEASRAEELLDDVVRRTRRVFGESHPTTRAAETELEKARGISRMTPRTPAGQVLEETVQIDRINLAHYSAFPNTSSSQA